MDSHLTDREIGMKANREMVTVWVTKYALTKGILLANGYIYGSMFVWRDNIAGSFEQSAHGEGGDWHRTEDAALDRASAMREAKIRSLNKSLKKIETMQFKIVEAN